MKTLWLCTVAAFLFLAIASQAFGTVDGPLLWSLHRADTVYLIRVSSFDEKTKRVNFAVIEALRGTPVKGMSLITEILGVKPNDEFVIFSSYASRNGRNGSLLGSESKPGVGWEFAGVRTEDSETYVWFPLMEYGLPVFDKRINDYSEYITLAHLKRLLTSD